MLAQMHYIYIYIGVLLKYIATSQVFLGLIEVHRYLTSFLVGDRHSMNERITTLFIHA